MTLLTLQNELNKVHVLFAPDDGLSKCTSKQEQENERIRKCKTAVGAL